MAESKFARVPMIFALAAALLGCSRPVAKIEREKGADFSRYRRIGVLAFGDRRGQGELVARKLEKELARLSYDPVDGAAIERLFARHGPDEMGLGLELLLTLRAEARVDAVVMGGLAPDWSSVSLMVVETEMGTPVLRAVMKPPRKGQKAFESVEEVVEQALRAFVDQPASSE